MRLELNDNPFTEEAAPQLGAMLRQQPHLKRLNLSDTSMCDEGVSTLAEALSESTLPGLACHHASREDCQLPEALLYPRRLQHQRLN